MRREELRWETATMGDLQASDGGDLNQFQRLHISEIRGRVRTEENSTFRINSAGRAR